MGRGSEYHKIFYQKVKKPRNKLKGLGTYKVDKKKLDREMDAFFNKFHRPPSKNG